MTGDNHRFEECWEARILDGLVCQWEFECYEIPRALRNRMQKPLFVLKDFANRLGCWTPEKREIALSRRLLAEYSWCDVCEVLRHEMAHQYVSEVLGALHEPAHGASFQNACRIFRANPRAAASYVPLSRQLHRASQQDSDKIRVRIEKLLALAGSSNPHEAESAMVKAHELMAKYETDQVVRRTQREYFSVSVGKAALRHFREDYILAHLLTDFYFVKGLWVSSYVITKGKMGTVLEISGTAQNIQIASYVFDFITQHIDSEWKRYNAERKLNRYRKTDFAVGILSGFRTRLEMDLSERQFSGRSHSLVPVEDISLKRYISVRYPHLGSIRQGNISCNSKIMDDGSAIGKKLVIRKGVTLSPDASVKFLE